LVFVQANNLEPTRPFAVKLTNSTSTSTSALSSRRLTCELFKCSRQPNDVVQLEAFTRGPIPHSSFRCISLRQHTQLVFNVALRPCPNLRTNITIHRVSNSDSTFPRRIKSDAVFGHVDFPSRIFSTSTQIVFNDSYCGRKLDATPRNAISRARVDARDTCSPNVNTRLVRVANFGARARRNRLAPCSKSRCACALQTRLRPFAPTRS
ncbi:hypothetical protein C8R47DRAFT_1326778, partial [Mycena vitilis]